MKGMERMTVLIDEPAWARNVLLYAKALAAGGGTRQIELLHVVPEEPSWNTVPDLPPGMLMSSPPPSKADRMDRVAQKREELQLLAREHLTGEVNAAVTVQILSGSPLFETLQHTLEMGSDLIVVGRHNGTSDKTDPRATLARRITRKAACSVLTLPEVYNTLPTRILVPVRDSLCSAHALETACTIASQCDAMVFAFNLYPIHKGTNRLRLPMMAPEDFPETQAKHECDRLMKAIDYQGARVEFICRPEGEDTPENKMLEAIDHLMVEAVVIGARGRTGAAGVLLGKVTERLIEKSPVPVLAVKKKGEMIGVLQAILELAKK